MAYACESEPIGESEPADLRAADGELFEPGMLESLTREQLTVIGMAVKNYDIKDIAKYRGTQPEQIDLVFENIRRQTQLSLRELAGLLIANGLIEPAPPRDEVIMPAEPSVQTVLARIAGHRRSTCRRDYGRGVPGSGRRCQAGARGTATGRPPADTGISELDVPQREL